MEEFINERKKGSMSTSWLMPEDLRETTGAAMGQGLEFLKRNVEADGAWPSRQYTNWELTGSWSGEFPPFLGGLGMLALKECANPASSRHCVRVNRP